MAVAALLIIVGGLFAHPALFPPAWAEQLHYKNSTGQYQSIVVYRNAADVTYADLAHFLDSGNESLKNAAFNDSGNKCLEYAARLHDDAERAMINCSIVVPEAEGSTPAHALVAFSPKDAGPVYVDPWSTDAAWADSGTINASRIIYLRDKWEHPLSMTDTAGSAVSIVEYRDAGPITYDRLMAFLRNDTTENAPYADPGNAGPDYAIRLHDAAEAQGIMCGIVSVSFTDGSMPARWLDAFLTNDMGTVYIDDTGLNSLEKDEGYLPADAVVYLEQGKELGELPAVEVNGSLDYGFYQRKKGELSAFSGQWEAYLSDFGYYAANKSNYDSQFATYVRDKAAYEDDSARYVIADDQYNSSVGTYTNEDLTAWMERLAAQHDNLYKAYVSLSSERNRIEPIRQGLTVRYDSLMGKEEAKWLTYGPTGIVKDAIVFW